MHVITSVLVQPKNIIGAKNYHYFGQIKHFLSMYHTATKYVTSVISRIFCLFYDIMHYDFAHISTSRK